MRSHCVFLCEPNLTYKLPSKERRKSKSIECIENYMNWRSLSPEQRSRVLSNALQELGVAHANEIVEWLEERFNHDTLPTLNNNSRYTTIFSHLEQRSEIFEKVRKDTRVFWKLRPRDIPSNWSDKYSILTTEDGVLDANIRVRRENAMVCIWSLSRGNNNPLTNKPYNHDFNDGIIRLLEIIRLNEWELSRIAVAAPGSECSLEERTLPQDYPLTIPQINLTDFASSIRIMASPIAASGPNNRQRALHWYIPDSFMGIDIEEVARIISGRNPTYISGENPNKIDEINQSFAELDGFQPEEDRCSDEGWVYILENPTWEGWLKIGKTKRIGARLSSFRVGSPHISALYRYVHIFPEGEMSEHAYRIEQEIHNKLQLEYNHSIFQPEKRGEWYYMTTEAARKYVLKHWF
uniref:Bacteriophage T5 Orf172 DNA-binding domain-containing protein n=1 Tax=uncultured marine group II/III euryarchaeote AD1000_34_D01 TaxID=1457757 RepID=A0A075FQ61_9EURY|nr:hypothetical protein [uncultured marine group II/III euryarchaeote AD1000_34_D01]